MLTTDLRCGDKKLSVMYDPEMMKHKNEIEDEDDHPECPERISRIFQVSNNANLIG